MTETANVAAELKPCKGRGKVVLGFFLYNLGFTILLDTNLWIFSWIMIAFGAVWLTYGHIEHYFVVKGVRIGVPKQSIRAAVFICLSILAFSPQAFSKPGLSPMNQIKEVDDLLKNYHNAPKGKALSDTEVAENSKIKTRVLKEDFDMTELCRLALEDHWKRLSAQKRSEFVNLFTNLLLSNAILHSEKHTGKEKIDYLSEQPIAEFKGRILVKTRIEVPEEAVDFDVDYAMLKDSKLDRWRIYDLILDKESLMQNYRDQFHQIIKAHSYDYLVQRMRKKLEEKQARMTAQDEKVKKSEKLSNKEKL